MHDELTYDNATHILRCRHSIGHNVREYTMRCHVLKVCDSGRLKILLHGERFWQSMNHRKRSVRYVDPGRVEKRT